MASAMSELIQRLSQKEQEQFKAEQRAAAKVKVAKGKVSVAAEENMFLQRAQVQELKALKAKLEKMLRDQAFECRSKVQKEIRNQARAEGEAKKAEMRLRRVQEHNYSLTLKIQDLQAHLERRAKEADAALVDLEERLTERVDQVERQGQQRVKSMKDHCMENSQSLSAKLDVIANNCQDQMTRFHIHAEGRTRFKELCQLAEKRGDYTMDDDTYKKAKGDLLGLWHLQQKAAPTRSSSPRGGGTPAHLSMRSPSPRDRGVDLVPSLALSWTAR